MRKPLLSICIPTYNRAKELQVLYTQTLRPIAESFEDVEIIICDNSDIGISKQNMSFLGGNILYHWNTENIGFADNVLKCFNLANGYYVWLLPDNDDVNFSNFSKLYKEILSTKKYDYIHLAILNENVLGIETVNSINYINPKQSLQNNTIPFVLLSSVIIKKGNSNVSDQIKFSLKGNSFIQIALFIENIKDYNNGIFFNHPIIKYKKELSGRFNILKLYDDMILLVNFLNDRNNFIDKEAIMLEQHKGTLNILLHAKIGLLKILDQKDTLNQYFQVFNQRYTSLNITVKRLLLKLPSWLLKYPMYIYTSIRSNEPIKTFNSLILVQKKVNDL